MICAVCQDVQSIANRRGGEAHALADGCVGAEAVLAGVGLGYGQGNHFPLAGTESPTGQGIGEGQVGVQCRWGAGEGGEEIGHHPQLRLDSGQGGIGGGIRVAGDNRIDAWHGKLLVMGIHVSNEPIVRYARDRLVSYALPRVSQSGVDMDRLSSLFARFVPTARVFYSGSLCTVARFDDADGVGHLHLLRGGRLSVAHRGGKLLTIERPSVLFYPRPCTYQLMPDPARGADLLCASVDLGAGAGNPVAMALPEVLILPLGEAAPLGPTMDLLFAEALGSACGRQAALDRLMECFLIQLLRYVMQSKTFGVGILAALGDARLAKAVTAMHERPEFSWSLDGLAEEAGMSRARFALRFRDIVGTTPLDYLTDWRLSVARMLLKRGSTIKAVARAVGYQSPAALTRIFTKKVGVSPSAWVSGVGRDTEQTSSR